MKYYRRLPRWGKIGIIVGLLFGFFYLYLHAADIQGSVAERTLHKLGFATTKAELAAKHPVSGQDAYPLYAKAYALCMKTYPRSRDIRGAKSPPPADLVSAYRSAAELAYVTVDDTSLDNFFVIDRASQILQLQSLLETNGSDWKQALDDANNIEKIAQQGFRTPTSAGTAEFHVAEMRALSACWRMARRQSDNPAALDAATKWAANLPSAPTLCYEYEQRLVEDREQLQIAMQHPAINEKDDAGLKFAKNLLRLRVVRSEMDAAFLQLWVKAVKSMPADPNDYRGYVKATSILYSTDPGSIDFTGICDFEPPEATAVGWVVNASRRALLKASIALLKIRAANGGKLPSKLPSGAVFTDPVTGAPFHYISVSGKYELYGVGADDKDNGGHYDDIVMHIEPGKTALSSG